MHCLPRSQTLFPPGREVNADYTAKRSFEDKACVPKLHLGTKRILSGQDGEDAYHYQEKQVRNAIRQAAQ